jgi:hypothetical protein
VDRDRAGGISLCEGIQAMTIRGNRRVPTVADLDRGRPQVSQMGPAVCVRCHPVGSAEDLRKMAWLTKPRRTAISARSIPFCWRSLLAK